MLNPSVSTSHSQNRRESEFGLPDEIVLEILSRLPAKDVLHVRSVCKRWRDLTCGKSFAFLHLRHCLPMVLFSEFRYGDWEFCGSDDSDPEFCYYVPEYCGSNHYLLDQWWEPLQTTPKIYQFGNVSEYYLLFSNGGLAVIGKYRDYMIMNPMYPEKVRITISKGFGSADIYGVFFHPSLEECCALFRLTLYGDFAEYKILTLGSKPCWRDINNPWSHLAMIWRIPPVLIDEHVYWVVNPEAGYKMGMNFPADIMEFDIRTEEFTFISSPVPEPYRCREDNINLFDIGGFLSLVRTSPFEDPLVKHPFQVNIWTLKDHARKLWTMSSYRIYTDALFSYRCPMALVNDELVLHDSRRLFSCNLKLGTLRKLEDKRYNASFLSTHVMSLVSLRNWKSDIHMDKWGEVEKNRKRRCDISGGVDENPVRLVNKEISYSLRPKI